MSVPSYFRFILVEMQLLNIQWNDSLWAPDGPNVICLQTNCRAPDWLLYHIHVLAQRSLSLLFNEENKWIGATTSVKEEYIILNIAVFFYILLLFVVCSSFWVLHNWYIYIVYFFSFRFDAAWHFDVLFWFTRGTAGHRMCNHLSGKQVHGI